MRPVVRGFRTFAKINAMENTNKSHFTDSDASFLWMQASALSEDYWFLDFFSITTRSKFHSENNGPKTIRSQDFGVLWGV